MSLLDKNIGIIGGGIGGLACAIFFAKFGSRVTIFEKASEISEVGAGIQISANGINILSKLKKHVMPKTYIFPINPELDRARAPTTTELR